MRHTDIMALSSRSRAPPIDVTSHLCVGEPSDNVMKYAEQGAAGP